MSDLLELAGRCEAATGPDRELNEAILLDLGWRTDGRSVFDNRGNTVSRVPDFTSSLDAAKTLWPGEVPRLIPSDPRICTAMALRARAARDEDRVAEIARQMREKDHG